MKRRAVLVSSMGSAQALPDRPLRFVVPYVPGGSTDTSARIVAEKLAQILGQPVVIENKTGGGKPEAYADIVAREIAKWRQVIKDSPIPAPN